MEEVVKKYCTQVEDKVNRYCFRPQYCSIYLTLEEEFVVIDYIGTIFSIEKLTKFFESLE